ncbi:MAG: hypothetical protein KGV50_03715 [Gammaproteobacteria bacterium]|nr:hypothetical protein [Gammaproteobacteria bacterium]
MYYLIEHNRTSKQTEWQEYESYSDAQTVVLEKEQEYFLNGQNEMEVVVFEANSIDELQRTHSRYFVEEEKENNIAGPLLAVGLVGLAIYLLKKED